MSPDLQQEVNTLRKQKARLEEDIDRLLTRDQLTGLYNRSAFISRVDAHFAGPESQSGQSALIEIGISGLPRITGSLGRHAGDYIISAIAARLSGAVENETLCCRLDYRSLALFIPRIADPLEALTTAKRLLQRLSEPLDWVDRKLNVELGAGVALSSATDRDAATLLHNAGLAYKSASARGGPSYAFFNPALAQAARRKSDVLAAVHEGLERQHFALYYQPFFNTTDGELVGFESLMRLNHPELGIISPAEFIPVAEEAGLISKLGGWALAEACRTAATWPNHLVVSVNVSPEQFLDGSLMTDVHNALELSSFPAYRLELEITESTMMGESEAVSSQVLALRELGCPIVLDDFGTGYSSLNYLWKFPFSKIKLDRSFIAAMDQSRVRSMIGSIMELSKNLGLKVTAEGIETPAQAMALKVMECDYLQGYLCGRPAPATDLAAIIMKRFAELTLPAAKPQQALPAASQPMSA